MALPVYHDTTKPLLPVHLDRLVLYCRTTQLFCQVTPKIAEQYQMTLKIKQTESLFCINKLYILIYIIYIHMCIYMRVQSLLSINNCRPFLQRQTNWQAFKLPAISLKRWVFTIRVKRGKTFLCDFRYTLVKLFWTSFFLLF